MIIDDHSKFQTQTLTSWKASRKPVVIWMIWALGSCLGHRCHAISSPEGQGRGRFLLVFRTFVSNHTISQKLRNAENPGLNLNPFACAMAMFWVVSLPPSPCVPASCFFHPHLRHWSKCGNSVEVLAQSSWRPFLTSYQVVESMLAQHVLMELRFFSIAAQPGLALLWIQSIQQMQPRTYSCPAMSSDIRNICCRYELDL